MLADPWPLSSAATLVWGKSQRDPYGNLVQWSPLAQHMADSAAIAALLWDRWIPQSTRAQMAADVGSVEGARTLLACLAFLHDIGKATPAFVSKDAELWRRVVAVGLPGRGTPARARELPHGLAGHLILVDALEARLGIPRPEATCFACIVGGHHGVPPRGVDLGHGRGLDEAMGDGLWEDVRTELMAPAFATLAAMQANGLNLAPSKAMQVLFTGAVIVADWLASSQDHFPLYPANWSPTPSYQPGPEATRRAATAWRALRFPARWTVPALTDRWIEDFPATFGTPAGTAPNGVQRQAVSLLARGARGPGILVIEAPMGHGKTEAALLAAQDLAHATGAGGLFVALPTRATTDAMFARVHRWLSGLVTEDDVPLLLAHGKAGLNEDFRGLHRLRLAEVGVDDFSDYQDRRRTTAGRTVAYEWMAGRKRGPLSSVVVGTIDQLLFLSLKARHLALRHLAISGKVVIVDEVHSYDAYMSSYLQAALRWLAAYRVPVVVLSATLAPSVRRSLIESYAGRPKRRSWRDPSPSSQFEEVTGEYPRLQWRGLDGEAETATPPPGPDAVVRIERIADTDAALTDCLQEALAEGGCALVIRNTVRSVQQTARALTEVFGNDTVSVAHSRFIATDRVEIDRGLLGRFGPAGARPAKAIVIASQVAEQSLDVDFDLLVSDLAPIDLLLQRIGRLHRHPGRVRPQPLAEPRVVLCGVDDWQGEPPKPAPGTSRVYSPWVLLRTLATLRDKASLCIPSEVPWLVAAVYEKGQAVPAAWSVADQALQATHDERIRESRERAKQFQASGPQGQNLLSWLDANVGEADDSTKGRAQVRDSAESLEVIALSRDVSGVLGLMPWMERLPYDLDGSVPIEFPTDRTVARSTLSLPAHLSTFSVIDELEPLMPPAFQGSPWLSGELVLTFDEAGRARLAGRTLQYTRRYGLEEVPDGS